MQLIPSGKSLSVSFRVRVRVVLFFALGLANAVKLPSDAAKPSKLEHLFQTPLPLRAGSSETPLPLRTSSSGHFERPAAAKFRKIRKLCSTQSAVSDERKFKYENSPNSACT